MPASVHLAPVVVTGRPLERGADEHGVVLDGAVAVDAGFVVDVGPSADLIVAHPGARVRRHDGVLTPGLVNAHTHLQYSSYAELATLGASFSEWIAAMIQRRAVTTDLEWAESARIGAFHALRSGTTAAADVVTDPAALAPLARSGLRGISYLEALGADDAIWRERHRGEIEGRVDTAPSGRAVGVSPHTLYTLSRQAFAESYEVARSRGLRIHTHLAETADEVEYVAQGTGQFADLARSIAWDMDLVRCGGAGRTPAAEMDALGGLGADVHVAHGVHCTAADRALLRVRGTAVAICVRSNRILGAGEPPIAAYLDEGSVIGIGTDSLASSPSLDLLEEAFAARALARAQGYDADDLDRRLFEALTLGGAACLGLAPSENESTEPPIGALRPGARADFAVFDVPTESITTSGATGAVCTTPYNPFEALITHGAGRCTATVLGGTFVHRRA